MSRRARLLALLVASLAVGSATVAAAATPASSAVPAGVTLGGVSIGGLSQADAVAAVTEAFERPAVLRVGGQKVTVAPNLLGLSVPVDSAVAAALAAAPGSTLALRATVSGELVSSYIESLAGRFDRSPVDAKILVRGAKPVVTKAVPGLRVDQRAAVRALTAQLVHGTRAPLALPAKAVAPGLTPATIGPVIVIRRTSNLLTLYDGAKLVRRFPVATGQQVYPTPLGVFHIVVMWENPTWYPPTQDAWAKGLKPVPPGPNNPLGTRWMGLDSPGIGIHGTDEPASIGYSASHGCIRMHVPDAEWLFGHVTVGTPVFIISA